MTDTIFRIKFELVESDNLYKYSSADPRTHKNTIQTVPNSLIPDEDWKEVITHETDDPWQQYNSLKRWEAADREFVRNVRLERLVSEPRWEPVT